MLYVPSFEGPHWHAIDAMTGDVLKKLMLNSGAHNTLYGPDGRRVYLAGLRSPTLSVADPRTHAVVGARRAVQRTHPAVHGQRHADAVLRERQRDCSASRSAT